MVTKNQIRQLILLIAVEYPRDINIDDLDTLNIKINFWHEALTVYDSKLVGAAAKRVLQRMHFCPKLADIVNEIKALMSVGNKSAEELWAALVQAAKRGYNLIGRFMYTARGDDGVSQGEQARMDFDSLYNGLPAELKRYCGNSSGFASLCEYDNEQLSFEKGRFLRRIEDIQTGLETVQSMSDELLKLVQSSNIVKQIDSTLTLPSKRQNVSGR